MTILRVACYERVSTDEQAMRGFSIDAQIDNLTEYCEKNNMKLVGHYTDAGISGSLSPLKRPALQRLLDDVQAGKIDMILFTKLDRWFRSVKEYFKVQDILDRHKVEWKAIHEDYDTSTANGRMAITIFMAIAQNERDKASERVKTVFAHKRKNKDAAIFGGRYEPFGYMRVKDEDGIFRLVKNPDEERMCEDAWRIIVDYGNISMLTRHMYNVYGLKKTSSAWRYIAQRDIYCGMYEGVEDFCEPYVSKEKWEKVQEDFQARKRDTTEKHIYLFTGMMHCPVCGAMLTATYTCNKYKDKKYPCALYRCRNKITHCSYKRSLSENTLEKMLCAELPALAQKYINVLELQAEAQKEKPKYNIVALRERLRTLTESYMAGNKTDEEYVNESIEIRGLITKAEQENPTVERDLTHVKKLMDDDFFKIYFSLEKDEKRAIWRSIITEIKLDDNQIADVVFIE